MAIRLFLLSFICFQLCHAGIVLSENDRFEHMEGILTNILERLEEKEKRISQLENVVQTQTQTIIRLEQKVQNQGLIIESLLSALEEEIEPPADAKLEDTNENHSLIRPSEGTIYLKIRFYRRLLFYPVFNVVNRLILI